MLIRNFKTCSNEITCHLFKTFCSNIYCSTLWCRFTDESMRRLKVAYNRVLRILMCLEHRTNMTAEFIVRDMDPSVVILYKAIASFQKRIFSNNNILVSTVVDSVQCIFYLLYTILKMEQSFVCFTLMAITPIDCFTMCPVF